MLGGGYVVWWEKTGNWMKFIWNDLIEAIHKIATQLDILFCHQNPTHKRQNYPIAPNSIPIAKPTRDAKFQNQESLLICGDGWWDHEGWRLQVPRSFAWNCPEFARKSEAKFGALCNCEEHYLGTLFFAHWFGDKVGFGGGSAGISSHSQQWNWMICPKQHAAL